MVIADSQEDPYFSLPVFHDVEGIYSGCGLRLTSVDDVLRGGIPKRR
jgi:hypothetical protein